MAMQKSSNKRDDLVAPDEALATRIFFVRGKRVMIDEELARLYNVPTRRVNEQVKRNLSRFPEDFMFQLTAGEWRNLKSQIATSSWGGRRKLPFAFTEHGILMLSSVLSSDQAVQVNIRIMRIFVKLRGALLTQKHMLTKIERLEKRVSRSDKSIETIFRYLKALLVPTTIPMRKIGFRRTAEQE